MDVASLADLLRETAERRGSFEAVAPRHDWWDSYAPRGRMESRRLNSRFRTSCESEAADGEPVGVRRTAGGDLAIGRRHQPWEKP